MEGQAVLVTDTADFQVVAYMLHLLREADHVGIGTEDIAEVVGYTS